MRGIKIKDSLLLPFIFFVCFYESIENILSYNIKYVEYIYGKGGVIHGF